MDDTERDDLSFLVTLLAVGVADRSQAASVVTRHGRLDVASTSTRNEIASSSPLRVSSAASSTSYLCTGRERSHAAVSDVAMLLRTRRCNVDIPRFD